MSNIFSQFGEKFFNCVPQVTGLSFIVIHSQALVNFTCHFVTRYISLLQSIALCFLGNDPYIPRYRFILIQKNPKRYEMHDRAELEHGFLTWSR